ncbi:MAG: GTPase HflX [Bdellovibrionales bacterium]|nr:GTPase HflX [Bdellovibrionales bacterium]
MLENEFNISKDHKAAIVSIITPSLEHHTTLNETNSSLNELEKLLDTLGVPVKSRYTQNRKKLDPGTLIGSGKLKEIAQEMKDQEISLLVFDCELGPGQIKNIKNITGIDVIDRCHVILEIFAEHARTREAKIQIELARLEYLLPRLSGFWTHFSRQKGGVGVRGGEGEQQIELDRRIVRQRIDKYKKELKSIVKSRHQQRKKRKNMAITAALVGYTNAGKSSLMNRLCKVNILEENKLFATLDSTFRTLTPDTKPPMILIDTVGFISNLPNTLIDGFKTTLESALEADLIIIVCDISDPDYKKHLGVTTQVLEELNINNKESIIVFNKKDQLTDPFTAPIITRGHKDSFVVSSFDEKDMFNLREYIINYFLEKQTYFELFIPYDKGEIHATIAKYTNIIKRHNHQEGIFYRVRSPSFVASNIGITPFILSPEDPLLEELSID